MDGNTMTRVRSMNVKGAAGSIQGEQIPTPRVPLTSTHQLLLSPLLCASHHLKSPGGPLQCMLCSTQLDPTAQAHPYLRPAAPAGMPRQTHNPTLSCGNLTVMHSLATLQTWCVSTGAATAQAFLYTLTPPTTRICIQSEPVTVAFRGRDRAHSSCLMDCCLGFCPVGGEFSQCGHETCLRNRRCADVALQLRDAALTAKCTPL